MSSLPVGLFETDLAGRLVSADDSFRALAHERRGRARRIGAVGQRPPRRSGRRRARRGGACGRRVSRSTTTFRVWTAEGRLVWVRLDATPKTRSVRAAHRLRRLRHRHHRGTAPATADRAADGSARAESRRGAHPRPQRLADVHQRRRATPVRRRQRGRPRPRSGDARPAADDPRPDPARGARQHRRRRRGPARSASAAPTASSAPSTSPRHPARGRRRDRVLGRRQIRDVTDRNHLQTELAHQATHDALTGLPNRTLLLRTLADALERARFHAPAGRRAVPRPRPAEGRQRQRRPRRRRPAARQHRRPPRARRRGPPTSSPASAATSSSCSATAASTSRPRSSSPSASARRSPDG